MIQRLLLILVLVLACLRAAAQPPETIYDGTVIATGFRQSIPLASDGPFPIGFSFTFFGNSYTQFYTSANGLVMFTDPDGLYNTETTIPTAAMPNNYIAPFWDNLSIIDGGNVMYRTIGVAPNRKCVIQYKKMGFDPVPTPFGTFSVILYETSNVIQMQYRLIVDPYSPASHGASATIGLENAAGTAGVTYAYHQPDAITTESAISFTPSGPTYTINPSAIYDGIFLTTNITLPDPGIVSLVSPALDATIGSSQTFQWSSAPNATSYILVIDTLSSLATAAYYDAGLNLSYDITGLKLDKTYYWAVFASNSTALTWCQIRRFNTTSFPPLAPVPQTIWAEQGQDKTIKLNYTGGDASPKTAIIRSLPAQGTLYQYNAGARGAQISSVPQAVTDGSMNIIYAASGSTGNGVGNFNFLVSDAGGDSPEATVTVNVSPPGIPNVLYFAKSANVEIQFDIPMSDPSGKQSQFTVTANGSPVTISSASLQTGDLNTVILTLASPLTGSETVTISYTQGDVTSAAGGFLLSFSGEPVTLTAQTISFTQSLDRKYNESPLAITATASSGLPLTYNSSNTGVATFSGSILTFHNTGTSNITLRQTGNGVFAPVKYVKTLTVSKGDQTISFSALPQKTFGDSDFLVSATSSSGLTVSFSSSNTSVATVTGNMIHITGAGSTVITASQAGNSLWSPAPDVPQTLIVNKVNQTISFGSIPEKTYGDPDFTPDASATSGLTVTFSSDNSEVAEIISNMVRIVAPGTAVITASQPGNDNYNPAPDVQQTLVVNKADQLITFNAIPEKTWGDPDFTPDATSNSGLTVFFSSDNPAVASIVNNMVHIISPGTALITASQPGNQYYNAAADVSQPLTIVKAGQVVTFDPIPGKIFNDPDFVISATSSSGLAVEFTSSNPLVATVSAGGTVHITGTGTTTITASQPGNDFYNAAADVQQPLVVGKADQIITFITLPDKVYGNSDFTLSATSSSGLAVSFASGNTAVAVVAGNSVHITGAGTAVMTASQPGDQNYNPAPDVQRTLTVNKAILTFTADDKAKDYLAPLPALTYTVNGFVNGEDQSVINTLPSVQTTATAGSAAGTYPITFSGGSDNNYDFTFVQGTLTITKITQLITFTSLPERLLVTGTFELGASSTSGLTLQFESLDTDIATVSGNIITGVARGTATIRAYHPGDQNYMPAETTTEIEVESTHKDILHLFTPNGDGINDYWELPQMAEWGKCEVRVYNRWGKLVFANDDYDNLWDGTSGGRPLPEGPYYFVIKTENVGVVKGSVNLVR